MNYPVVTDKWSMLPMACIHHGTWYPDHDWSEIPYVLGKGSYHLCSHCGIVRWLFVTPYGVYVFYKKDKLVANGVN